MKKVNMCCGKNLDHFSLLMQMVHTARTVKCKLTVFIFTLRL